MSRDFRGLCERHGIAQSVGRIGSSQDNAVAESFWASLKRELVSPLPLRHAGRGPPGDHRLDQPLQRRTAARSLGNVPPIEWELRFTRRRLASRITMCPADGGKAKIRGPKWVWRLASAEQMGNSLAYWLFARKSAGPGERSPALSSPLPAVEGTLWLSGVDCSMEFVDGRHAGQHTEA